MVRSAIATDVFSAVAEPNRRDLLELLGVGEATVGELVDAMGISQPRVSKHLGVLRDAGLVRVRVDGRYRRYRVNGSALRPIDDWVRRFERAWNDRLDRLDDVLAEREQEESP